MSKKQEREELLIGVITVTVCFIIALVSFLFAYSFPHFKEPDTWLKNVAIIPMFVFGVPGGLGVLLGLCALVVFVSVYIYHNKILSILFVCGVVYLLNSISVWAIVSYVDSGEYEMLLVLPVTMGLTIAIAIAIVYFKVYKQIQEEKTPEYQKEYEQAIERLCTA